MPDNTAFDIAPVTPSPADAESLLEGEGEQESQEDREYRLVRENRAKAILVDDLTCKIDHILYTEWDPIGVHALEDFDCFDEYHDYLPGLVELVRADASLQAISDQLMVVEGYILGPDALRRRCDVIAVMVRQYGPHAARHPFVVTVHTDTPQAAYQSVLDLVTQTRLDAYEKRWEAVCNGYETAVQLCRAFLPRQGVLVGACLNNLGQAYTMVGHLEPARAALEDAARWLKPQQYKGRGMSDLKRLNMQLYTYCLSNLITHLAYRGRRAAAVRYARALLSDSLKRHGEYYSHAARVLLRQVILQKRLPTRLGCTRLSVEQDGCGVIGQVMVID